MTADDARRIAADFGLEGAGAHAERLAGGYSNECWRVAAPERTVVVRRYGRLHVSAAAIAFEHAVIDHVAARLDEVRAPLRNATGASYQLDGGAYVAAFPWIPGTTGARDLNAGRAAARMLASYHRAARDMHVAGGMGSARFLGALAGLHERFKAFAAAGSPIARALPWDELIVALGASTLRLAPLVRALPHVIVHGDPNPANFVVADGAVRGLIDFDFTHETERIYDVGAFVDEFARADESGPLQVERVAPLVDAYAEAAPLSAAERLSIGDAILRHAATLTCYVTLRHGERTPGDLGGAPLYADRMREIARSIAPIRAALA